MIENIRNINEDWPTLFKQVHQSTYVQIFILENGRGYIKKVTVIH